MSRIRTYQPDINFLDSQQVRVKTGGVTIDATKVKADKNGLKILPAGTLVVKDKSNHLYRTLESPADDSFEFVVNETFITVESVNLAYGNALCGVYDMARIKEAYLPTAIKEEAKKVMPFILFV